MTTVTGFCCAGGSRASSQALENSSDSYSEAGDELVFVFQISEYCPREHYDRRPLRVIGLGAGRSHATTQPAKRIRHGTQEQVGECRSCRDSRKGKNQNKSLYRRCSGIGCGGEAV